MERMTGIEPVYAAWKAAVLPLNYIREPENAAAFDTFGAFPQLSLTQAAADSVQVRFPAAAAVAPMQPFCRDEADL